MKECPNCKTKNKNDAEFCTGCGADLKDIPATADEWTAAAGDLLNKAKEAAATGAKKAKEAAAIGAEKVQKAVDEAEKKMEAAKAKSVSAGGWDTAVETPTYASGTGKPQKGSNILVDQSEQVVATIGNNYLQNFLSGGSVGKGIGVLTQKRFYYKGRNFSGTGKAMKSTTEEGVVSIDDIAFTMFSHTRHIGALIFAILLTVAGVVCLPIRYMEAYGLISLAAALVFYIMYFVNRMTLFIVTFPGGRFGFDIRYYPIADIRDFQRQLHLLKDHNKEGGDA